MMKYSVILLLLFSLSACFSPQGTDVELCYSYCDYMKRCKDQVEGGMLFFSESETCFSMCDNSAVSGVSRKIKDSMEECTSYSGCDLFVKCLYEHSDNQADEGI